MKVLRMGIGVCAFREAGVIAGTVAANLTIPVTFLKSTTCKRIEVSDSAVNVVLSTSNRSLKWDDVKSKQ